MTLPGGCKEGRALVESASPQVVGDDDIRDGVEDELDVVGVGGAGDVRVDLLVGGLVLALVLSLDVSHRLCERAGACESRDKRKKSGSKRSRNPKSIGCLQQPCCRDMVSSYGAAATQSPRLHLRDRHYDQPGLLQGGDVLRLSAQLYFYSELLFIAYRDEMGEGTEC